MKQKMVSRLEGSAMFALLENNIERIMIVVIFVITVVVLSIDGNIQNFSIKIINDIKASHVFTILQSVVHKIHTPRHIGINRSKQGLFHPCRKPFLSFAS